VGLTVGGCGGAERPNSTPEGTDGAAADVSARAATAVPDTERERVSEATKGGERILLIKNVPGPLFDTTAGVPPPDWKPPQHRFLSARCMRDAMLCVQVGELLRASRSIDEFFQQLRGAGYVVREVDASSW